MWVSNGDLTKPEKLCARWLDVVISWFFHVFPLSFWTAHFLLWLRVVVDAGGAQHGAGASMVRREACGTLSASPVDGDDGGGAALKIFETNLRRL